MKDIWTIEEALTLIRKVQPDALRSGYALSLGGSVLNCGFSWKDLDIVAFPGALEQQDESGLLCFFVHQGFKTVKVITENQGIMVFKLQATLSTLKIDLIIPVLDRKEPLVNTVSDYS